MKKDEPIAKMYKKPKKKKMKEKTGIERIKNKRRNKTKTEISEQNVEN